MQGLTQIKFLEKEIKYLQESAEKYRNLKSTEFNLLEIDKIGKKIASKRSEIYDIINPKVLTEEEEKKIIEDKIFLEQVKNEEKIKLKAKLDRKALFRQNKKRTYSYIPSENAMIKDYEYFIKNCNKVPEYIKKNLSNMPNNKGYIWNDIYCYGEKPPEKNKPCVMFEKVRNGDLHIHEWTKTEYKILCKKRGEKMQEVIYYEKRRPS